jgi:PAS domain S-box-containing protein
LVNNKVNTHDILKGISAGLCLLNRNFHIIWTNKLQSDWFGSSQNLYGKHCYEIFQHRSHICPGCPTKKVFNTGVVQVAKSATGFTKDGQKRYYQLTVSPIKDNSRKVVFVLELVQDVTDRIIQERLNSKVIQKLNRMYQNLHGVNKRLRASIPRLKDIVENLKGSKRSIEKKYRKKKNELFAVKEELQDIFKVNRTLASTVDLKKIFSLITRLTCELMQTDTCVLRLLNEDKKTLVINSSYCISDNFIQKSSVIKLGEGIGGIVAQTKKPLAVYDIDKDSRVKSKELMKKEGLRSMLAVPVVFQDKVLGVISTGSKKARHFLEEEIEVLDIFASQVAIAIQEARHYDDIHINYFNTIHALVLAIEARDPYTRGHTERVTKYSIEVGRALKMYHNEMEILRYAAEVHDVGKISVPDFILNKPGKLNPVERAMVELHPVKGAEMLEPLAFLRPALPIVRHHHERYDGTGYPDGLEKDKIPLMARILACADAFDAMTSDRSYRRRKLTTEEALMEIRNNAGSQFDPNIARLFVKTIRTKSLLRALP